MAYRSHPRIYEEHTSWAIYLDNSRLKNRNIEHKTNSRSTKKLENLQLCRIVKSIIYMWNHCLFVLFSFILFRFLTNSRGLNCMYRHQRTHKRYQSFFPRAPGQFLFQFTVISGTAMAMHIWITSPTKMVTTTSLLKLKATTGITMCMLTHSCMSKWSFGTAAFLMNWFSR